MNNKGQADLAVMVTVALVAGVIGLTIVGALLTPMTGFSTQAEQNVTLVNGTAVTLGAEDMRGVSPAVTPVGEAALTLDTNYTIDTSAGTITLIDANYDGNLTTIGSFSYAEDEYIESSLLRLVLDNIPILFAVGLLIVSIMVGGSFVMN